MRPSIRRLSIGSTVIAACIVCLPGHAQIAHGGLGLPVYDIPGLTGFVTTGADMSGLSVRATFSNGLIETRLWTTTGPAAGGVSGSGWSLSLDGDSFSSPWMFDFGPNLSTQLTNLLLEGSAGLTVFDRAEPNPGTSGSAQGSDISFANGSCGSCGAFALYFAVVSIGGAQPVGDIFHSLTLSFTEGTGPRGDWSFLQDTDNDSRFVPGIPEPETYALMLGGMGFMAWAARRRRKPA